VLRKATIDTVSGSALIDSAGETLTVSVNTVSGNATVRLDEGYPANYVVRSVSGRVQIDGVVRSGNGTGPTTNYVGSVGELSGSFADVRAHSVSGDITVLRRAATPAPDAAPAAPEQATTSSPTAASGEAAGDESTAREAAAGFDRGEV
jgi:hypothetical protein